ncbi:MAG: hypothetical protein RL380_1158 [Verrucomicrobiota bacterium]
MTNPLEKLNLRPFEKRLVLITAVLFILALNAALVWPRFKDWGETDARLTGARAKLETYNKAIDQQPQYEKLVKVFESEGESVAEQDQANRFLLTVQSQASASGVQILATMRPGTSTNDPFFIEQRQTFHVQAREENLIDFLYQLGAGDSMARARGLSFRPGNGKMQLDGNIDLIANYQRKAAAPAPKKSETPAAAPKPAAPTIRSTPKPIAPAKK